MPETKLSLSARISALIRFLGGILDSFWAFLVSLFSNLKIPHPVDKTKDANQESDHRKKGTAAKHFASTPTTKGDLAEENSKASTEASENGETAHNPSKVFMGWVKKSWAFITDSKHSNALIAIVTFFIFLSGVAYTAVSCNQLSVMKDTLIFEHRPWVGIAGSGNFTIELTENNPLKITMKAENVGGTPALNLITVNKMSFTGPQDPLPDFGGYSKSEASPPIVLFPGSITTINLSTDPIGSNGISYPHLNSTQVEWVKTGITHVYVYGSMWYDDTFHSREHRTDYCFSFDAKTSTPSMASFVSCKTHNYAD